MKGQDVEGYWFYGDLAGEDLCLTSKIQIIGYPAFCRLQ